MLSFQNFPCISLIHFTLSLSHFLFVDVDILTILPSWLRLCPPSAATRCVVCTYINGLVWRQARIIVLPQMYDGKVYSEFNDLNNSPFCIMSTMMMFQNE